MAMGLCVAVFLGGQSPVFADDAAEMERLKQENVTLRQRVDALEGALKQMQSVVGDLQKEIKGRADAQATAPVAPAGASGGAQVEGLTESDVAKLKRMAATLPNEKKKKSIWSQVDAELYGYIKTDVVYDSDRTFTGNFAAWVERQNGASHDNHFNMTANQSRFGLNLKGPGDSKIKTSGKFEFDLYGSAPENKPGIMVRHAYIKLDWPEERFSIIAGQTWDVIAPLNPSTLNYTVAWWAGNIGYRRPQIRFTKVFGLDEKVDLKLEGALLRNIGITGGGLFDPGDTGEDSAMPLLEGRMSVSFPLAACGPTVIGVSGHWAQEHHDYNALNQHDVHDTWSACVDITQPITDWIVLQGEYFVGENLKAFLGGIGQGIDLTKEHEIQSNGGWAAFRLTPWDKWTFNLGFSIENVRNSDLSLASQREFNSSIFGNFIYDINAKTQVGIEVSRWHTRYVGPGNGSSLRMQTSLIYKF